MTNRRLLLTLSAAFLTISLGAPTGWRCAAGEPADATRKAEGELTVHEWGTFTTFSGSDGMFLEFRPLVSEESDLPDFVLDRASFDPNGRFMKARLRGRVRMETPVTYFYTDRIRDVNVRVAFPEGLLTEFYPPVQQMLPKFDAKAAYREGEAIGNSSLDWGTVTLIPTAAILPGIEDEKRRDMIARHIAAAVPPTRPADNHYVQARATDSALVHVLASDHAPFVGHSAPKRSFMEKFLFYRGVGNFQLPYKSEFDSRQRIVFHNQGSLPMSAAVLIRVEGKAIHADVLGKVAPGTSEVFDDVKPVKPAELVDLVRKTLVAEGLYDKEAASMVATWRESWFTEQGTRILYIVPPSLTDELLPLTVTPRPQETLRVLVGRMEVMSPQVEQRLIQAVTESARQRAAFLKRVADQKPQKEVFAINEQIRGFGRLTEPALVRVSKIARDPTVRLEAEMLVAQLRRELGVAPEGALSWLSEIAAPTIAK